MSQTMDAYRSVQEITPDTATIWMVDWVRIATRFSLPRLRQALNELRLTSEFFPLPSKIYTTCQVLAEKAAKVQDEAKPKFVRCGECLDGAWVRTQREDGTPCVTRCHCYTEFFAKPAA